MWLPSLISRRYLIVFISCTKFLLILYYLSGLYSSSRNSFPRETLFLSLANENNNFDEAIRRRLSTHSMVYNNAKACGLGNQLDATDQQILNNVTILLPELRKELLPYPDEYFKDRGIVLTVGSNQLLHTKFNLRIIQWLKIKLGVEVWYSSTQISNNKVNELLNYVPKLNLRMCCFETARCWLLNGKEISVQANHVHAPRIKKVQKKIYSFKLAAYILY